MELILNGLLSESHSSFVKYLDKVDISCVLIKYYKRLASVNKKSKKVVILHIKTHTFDKNMKNNSNNKTSKTTIDSSTKKLFLKWFWGVLGGVVLFIALIFVLG